MAILICFPLIIQPVATRQYVMYFWLMYRESSSSAFFFKTKSATFPVPSKLEEHTGINISRARRSFRALYDAKGVGAAASAAASAAAMELSQFMVEDDMHRVMSRGGRGGP